MHYESTPLEKLDEYSEQFRNGKISARDYLLKFRDAAKRVPYDPSISLAAKALRIQMDFNAAKPSRVEEADRKEAMEIFEAAIGHDTGGLTTQAGPGAPASAQAKRNAKALAELDALSEKFANGEISPSEYLEEFRETAARAPADPKHPISAKALQIQIDFDAAPAGTVTDAHREAAMDLFAAALDHDRVPAGHEAQMEHLIETSVKAKAKSPRSKATSPESDLRAAARAKAKANVAPGLEQKRGASRDR